MRGVIKWNGALSDQFGIDIEKYPNYTKPKRKMDVYSVPGRSGDIIMMQNAWDNTEQEYDIVAGSDAEHSVQVAFDKVADWLCSPKGYCELWDSFDPEHFRLAYFEGPLDVESFAIGRGGRAKISFNCKPQRYLVAGKLVTSFKSATSRIYNPTAYDAKPLLFIERSAAGNGTVTVNGTMFTITDIPDVGLYIDCDELNCYDPNGNNMNSRVVSSSSEFALLSPGYNVIGITGNIDTVSITPHWFEI